MATVPHDERAEKSVLGAILIHRDAIVAVASWLFPGDFYGQLNAVIYQAALSCLDRREPPDLVTVAAELERCGELQHIGGGAALSRLVDEVPTAIHIEHYGRIVLQLAERRRLLKAAGEIARIAHNGSEEPDAMRASALATILQSGAHRGRTVEGRAACGILLDELGQIARAELSLPSFGIAPLDKLIMLRPGSLTIVGARTSEGKTSLACALAWNMARAGRSVLYVSTEMRPVDMQRRLMSAMTHMPFPALCARLNPEQMAKVADAMGQVGEWPGSVDYLSGALSMDCVRLEAMTRRAMDRLDLLVIDYVQKLRNRGKTIYEQVTNTSSDIQFLAQELEIPIVAVSQLSRKALGKERPTMDDLKESGGQEQDADAVLLLQRDPECGGSVLRPVLWWLDKNRNGPLGQGALLLDTIRFTFEEM